jgi:hypothetical protein
MTLTSSGDAPLTACTHSHFDSDAVPEEKCGNPLCGKVLEPKKRRAHVKLYCDGKCRQSASILRRAAALLEGFSDDQAFRILRKAKEAVSVTAKANTTLFFMRS